jgi:1,4-dihydroxy-6-naphthoate synthase
MAAKKTPKKPAAKRPAGKEPAAADAAPPEPGAARPAKGKAATGATPKPAARKPSSAKSATKPEPRKAAAEKRPKTKASAALPAADLELEDVEDVEDDEGERSLPARQPLAPERPRSRSLDDDDGDGDEEADEPAPTSGADEEEEGAAPRPKAPLRPVPKMPPRQKDGVVTLAHSPDADDAFMFYALRAGKVDTEGRTYELVGRDIQALNEEARKGTFDVTAISFAAYPKLADRYAILSCGASFGDHRGPVLVAGTPVRTHEVQGLTVAVPGLDTTAALVLRLWLPHAKLKLVEVPFDEVIPAIREGRTRAGVLIHERQLTWREENLVRVVDFGQWWAEKTEGLPLPLGANAIRRDIPPEERTKIALDLKRSIAYGLGHREEALDHAVPFAKGLPRAVVDRYVATYVNELALNFAERGRQAIREFYAEAVRHSLLPDVGEPEFS